MNTDLGHGNFVKIFFFSLLAIFSILLMIVAFASISPRSRASANTLTLKIKVQGGHNPNDQLKALVDFYDGPNKVFEQPEALFTYKDGVFSGDIVFQPGFNFTKPYALFVKPMNYVGRIFCTVELTGNNCRTPGFFFLTSGSVADLTGQTFLGGDLTPPNGKVDALDMSLIMKNLRKLTASTTQNTDLNNNGITDVVDYSLALYSLSKNAADDTINLTAPIQPTATPSTTPTPAPTRTPTPTPTPVHTVNPFGVMTWGDTNQIKTQAAKTLGAIYYRPISVFLDKWTGTCAECDAAVAGGLKLVLTIRANGGPGNPTVPPTDWNAYRNILSQVLDKYKPELLVIENEENSSTFYTGTSDQFLAELKVGCEVAHSKNIKCTNGGLVSKLVVVLVSESYKPDTNKADNYLRRALTPEDYDSVAASIGSSVWLSQIQKGQELLAGYKANGADFVNFHWHQENAETIPEAVTYLGSASQGLPVINNEISPQKSISVNQVTSFMQKVVELNWPYAIWYSNDADGIGGPTALTDKAGVLNDSGRAYQQFIVGSFGKSP